MACFQCCPGFLPWPELVTAHTCPSGVLSLLMGITPLYSGMLVLFFSVSAGSLSLGSFTLLAGLPLYTQELVWTWGFGPLWPTTAGSLCQSCRMLDHSLLNLDNPPCLTLFPWPPHLVFPAFPLLGKPV